MSSRLSYAILPFLAFGGARRLLPFSAHGVRRIRGTIATQGVAQVAAEEFEARGGFARGRDNRYFDDRPEGLRDRFPHRH